MKNIKELPAIDRPREKLILNGPGSLNDTELLAILLGSGSSEKPVLALARNLFGHLGHLSALSGWSTDQLCTIKGIGPTKAAVLLAAAELSSRQRQRQTVTRITNDEEAINLVRPLFAQTQSSQYILILLNRNRELLATSELFISADQLPQIGQIITLVIESGAYGFGLVRNTAVDEQRQAGAEQQLLSDLSAAGKMLRIRFFGCAIIPP